MFGAFCVRQFEPGRFGKRLETYAHPPISFYKFKRISFKPRRAQSERNDPPTEAEAVRRAAS